MARRNIDFQTIRSEGGLLPPDLLRRVLDPKEKLDGTRPEDYGLPQGERLNEVITQSWNRLRKHWAEFRVAAANLPEGEAGTGLTNDKFSLPLLRELGFGLLPTSAGPEISGRVYAINRFFGPVPIHLVGCGVNLDRRAAGVRGAAVANPHGLVQEFLNRSVSHKWGVLSNGFQFRILRDNQALSRQSFLEFDLEAMFVGEVYSDFVLLWLIAHATRFAPRETDQPESCWLEDWTKIANEQGTRALLELRGGVEKALEILGEGFTAHPKNSALRDALRTGNISLADFHAQLLRIVYRLIFLFVAEDRTIDGQALLHARDDSERARLARECYAANYSTARLRELASRIKGSRHGDLWNQFHIIVGASSGYAQFAAAREHLALPALGSFLWDPGSTSALNDAELTNHDFLEALRHLAFTRPDKVLRPVDFKNLGAEELGGVYETLLALTPQISADGARFTFAEFAGNERKTSGSYYTPDSLVQSLLDSALDPVVEEALKGKTGPDAEKAILALKVCDPAVGSGHFLVGAAHRLARHLARVRAVAKGESEPSPLLYQHALRDVIGHCLYGVDMNPMAAELCRVSLWLEALEPGKPLSFLEHRIQFGNSLLGATPALLTNGIPDEAFTPIEGDDKEICKEFKRINRDERDHQGRLFAATTEPWQQLGNLAVSLANLEAVTDDSIEGIREKQRLYEQTVRSSDYLSGRFWADTWCAAFVWKKTREFKYPVTEEVFRRIEHNPHTVDAWMREEIERLAAQYQFFHWHLAFPDVFHVPESGVVPTNARAGWTGGFDCVLGNPPWERLQMEQETFFAAASPEIAAAKVSQRARLIVQLRTDNPSLAAAWDAHRRSIDAASVFVRLSGLYPLSGRGKFNTAALFTELALQIVGPLGRCGVVVPTGVVTDEAAKNLFDFAVRAGSVRSLFDFINARGLFPGVHPQYRFSLLTLGGKFSTSKEFMTAFMLLSTDELRDATRTFAVTADDIQLINPNTGTCPSISNSRDFLLVKSVHARHPVMIRHEPAQNPWGARPTFMFQMSDDEGIYRDVSDVEIVPSLGYPGGRARDESRDPLTALYEAKLIHQYDHRFATFEGLPVKDIRDGNARVLSELEKMDPSKLAITRFWIPSELFHQKLEIRPVQGQWFITYREVTNATNERTMIAAITPFVAAGRMAPQIYLTQPTKQSVCFLASINSFAFDFVCRSKLTSPGIRNFFFEQMPIPVPDLFREPFAGTRASDWICARVLELIYTSWDLGSFAQDCEALGPPFQWSEARRFLLRCELEAAFFHFYLPAAVNGGWGQAEAEELGRLKASFPTPRDAVAYILDTFPIVKRKDEESFNGDYRTKRVILEIYDALAESTRTGTPYQTRLDPPPADPSCRHPKKKVGVLAFGSLIKDPGLELEPRIVMRIKTQTPFPVEYAKISGKTRGGAPTLALHPGGSPVSAEILVLNDVVTVDEATNMLWRRETRKAGTGETYRAGTTANSVLVQQFTDDPCVGTVLYTDFPAVGKINHPTAEDLATRAIQSVSTAEEGRDGITYLMDAIKSGIWTPLTSAYQAEILGQAHANSLDEAVRILRGP